MKVILCMVATLSLLATATAKATPIGTLFGLRSAGKTVAFAQWKKRAKKRFKGGEKKRKGPRCFNTCISKGNPAPSCNARCR